MGSLMAGWNTPSLDPKTARLRRNRSLMKEEIESYWKSKKKSEEELFRAIDSPSDGWCVDEKNGGRKYTRSSSFPPSDLEKDSTAFQTQENWENFSKMGWWTRSNSAFLNEPPVLSENTSKPYTSQFHVADMAASSKLVT